MARVFEMNRRAREPIKCDSCGDTIEVGQRWYFRRAKTKYGWKESNICEDCRVFGPPTYSFYDLPPLVFPEGEDGEDEVWLERV